MFSRLSCLMKNVPQRSYNYLLVRNLSKTFSALVSCPDIPKVPENIVGDVTKEGDVCGRNDNLVKDGNSINYKDVEIFDVNVENMMDEDIMGNIKPEPPKDTISAVDCDGAPLAPIDIDPWVDELQAKEGTVDFDLVEQKEKFIYPEPPKDRDGLYEFDGIKIWLPKKLLTTSTYRYCLDPEDKRLGVDSIRICKFDKSGIQSNASCSN